MQIPKKAQEVINKLKKRKEVVGIFLFGSYAKDSATQSSDVDLAVVLNTNKPDKIAEVESFSTKGVDVIVVNDSHLLLKYSILKEGKIIYSKKELFDNNMGMGKKDKGIAWFLVKKRFDY